MNAFLILALYYIFFRIDKKVTSILKTNVIFLWKNVFTAYLLTKT